MHQEATIPLKISAQTVRFRLVYQKALKHACKHHIRCYR